MPGDLPLLYHTHHSFYQQDLDYWRGLAERQGGPVLELGCGGGRVLLAIASAGFTVVGLDRDPEMLAILKAESPPELRPRAAVFQADMNHFSLNRTFGLVIMPCNTLSALPDTQRLAVLKKVAGHISPGGRFAASLPNPHSLHTLAPFGDPELEAEFDHPATGNPVQVSSSWLKTAERVEMYWHYDHLLPDGSVVRSTAAVSHSLASVERYRDELSAAGLEVLEMQGDFDGRPYEPESPGMLLLCSLR